MTDLLITGGPVLTMDAGFRVLPEGAVAIKGGRITAVASARDLAAMQAARTIDAAGMLVMPGLIDAHAHAGHGLVKSMGTDVPNAWEDLCGLVYTQASPPEFWQAEAALAALERLRFGTTCGVSLLGGGDTIMRSDRADHADAHCEGALSVGIRNMVAIGPTRPPHPLTYADWQDDVQTKRPVGFEDQLRVTLDVLRRWHDTHAGRALVALLTPVLRDEHVDQLGPALMDEAIANTRRVHALACDHGVVFTQDGHWRGSVRRAQEIGMLGPNTLLSHCIDLHENEVDLIARTNTKVAHNPSAVASIMGRCPAIELRDKGAVVALGSDATAPDRSADMFRHVQQAMHYHRTHFRDPSVLPPGEALAMATIDGARALGLEAEIGSLEVGKRADVVLLDLARPHLAPQNMPAYRAACFANGNDVHTVIVGGEVLLDDRRATRVNEAHILAEAERQAEKMISRTDSHALLALPDGFFWSAPMKPVARPLPLMPTTTCPSMKGK